MQVIYSFFITIIRGLLPVISLFNPKVRLFYKGQKTIFKTLHTKIKPSDKTIWMHCASLGEFEQGRPVIERIKEKFPKHKIIISFFSPSGYEVRKNYPIANAVVYLPLDSYSNAIKFINIIHPSLVLIVKYDFWPNMLRALKKQQVKTLLISGIFRKNQIYFSKKTKWFRNSLKSFSHFFVQNEDSVTLLKSIGFYNTTETGDTRFDRVLEILQQREEVPFLKDFCNNKFVLISGSTWPDDEKIITEFINTKATDEDRFIIAPHNIHEEDIKKLSDNIHKKTLLYSKINNTNYQNAQVLIIDSIGILTKVYAYADIAYVGGGFGVGIHNILEPATYAIPVIIGPNYQKFQEAKDLIQLHACFEIKNLEEFSIVIEKFKIAAFRKKTGEIAFHYIKENSGATQKIIDYVIKVL